MDVIVPIFEGFNEKTKLKPQFFEDKELRYFPDTFNYHISLMEFNGVYVVTTVLLNLSNDKSCAYSAPFSLEERHLMLTHVRLCKSLAEIQDWHYLWFEGKSMTKEEYLDIKNSWFKTILTKI